MNFSTQISYTPLPSEGELDTLPHGYEAEASNRPTGADERSAVTSIFDDDYKEGYGAGAGSRSIYRFRNTEWIQTLRVWFWIFITPSFLASSGKPEPARKQHPTAWLDGLRGVASLFVVFHHSSVLWFFPLNRGWGSSPADYTLVQFPIIRLFYSGNAMVAIFFVVSGISLSYKTIGLIRKGRFEDVLDCLSSSVMRRAPRLVIPPAVVTFFSMLATYFHWYGVGPGSRQPPQSDYLWDHLKSWYYSVIALADPFRPRLFPGGYNPTYDTNMWTIPVEFHGSMVIFTVVLGLSKVRTKYRIMILTGIVGYASYYAYSHLFLFLAGILLTELHYERINIISYLKTFKSLPFEVSDEDDTLILRDSTSERQTKLIWGVTGFWCINFVISLYFLSMPHLGLGGNVSPGYKNLAKWLPDRYRGQFIEDTFWIFNGAVHLVFTIDNATFLQAIFTTRIAQYLGKISFALYICHGTFLYTLGWNLSARMALLVGSDTRFHYVVAVFLTGCVLYPALFWTADRVAVGIDMKSVTFAKRLFNRIAHV